MIGAVSSAVSDLNEDEQSEDNLALVAMAIDSLQGLVANGQIVVTESVSTKTVYICTYNIHVCTSTTTTLLCYLHICICR